MRNLIKKFSITIIILGIIVTLMTTPNIYATTGSFSLSTSSVNAKVGETSTFSLSVSNCEGKFSIKSSNDSIVSVSTNSTWVSKSETITITAKSAGTATITVTASDVADTNEEEISGSKTISVTVTDNSSSTQTTTSTLTSAVVGGKTFTADGKMTVSSSTKSVKVTAVGEDYTVNGYSGASTIKLEEGTNTITIKGTSSGKTIKVYVAREAETVTTTPNIMENTTNETTKETVEEDVKLTTLDIEEGLTLNPEFSSDIYSYNVEIKMDEKDYSELTIKAISNIDDAKIEIQGADNLQAGENIINIIVSKADGSDSRTYQIIVNKIIESTEIIAEATEKNTPTYLNNTYILIGAIAVVIIILIIILVIVYLKKHKKSKKKNIESSESKEDINDINKEEDKVECNIEGNEENSEIQKDKKEIIKDEFVEGNMIAQIYQEKYGDKIEISEEKEKSNKDKKQKGKHVAKH